MKNRRFKTCSKVRRICPFWKRCPFEFNLRCNHAFKWKLSLVVCCGCGWVIFFCRRSLNHEKRERENLYERNCLTIDTEHAQCWTHDQWRRLKWELAWFALRLKLKTGELWFGRFVKLSFSVSSSCESADEIALADCAGTQPYFFEHNDNKASCTQGNDAAPPVVSCPLTLYSQDTVQLPSSCSATLFDKKTR